ncbi:MAG: hypothetical protein M3232_01375 [Thermoproteota archaeon]|nr:hypothetical protein [Thermoproteota archaeon]
MTRALTFDPLQVKRAVMIGSAYIAYWPIARTVAVAITLTKECQHSY